MAQQNYELSDMSNTRINLDKDAGRKEAGTRITAHMGFILLFLAVSISVGVGVIIHFTGEKKEIIYILNPPKTEKKLSANSNKMSDIKAKPSVTNDKHSVINDKHSVMEDKPPIIVSEQSDMGDESPTVSNEPSTEAFKRRGQKRDLQEDGGLNCTTSTHGQLSTITPTPPASTVKPKVTDVRLPKSVYPLHYDVFLQPYMQDPDPKKFTFKGGVKILIRCDSATDNITLHVNVITINTSSVRFMAETPSISGDPQITGFENDTDRQFFIVRLDKNMEVTKNYIIEMDFTSPLKNDLHGLYYSEYTRGGKSIYLAATQFQPTDARKVFPCFDEPAIKATFNITLIRPSDRISISNMPIIDNSTTFQENGITYVMDVYQETRNMSTYLLAFIICDFDYIHNTTKNNVTYRAWAAPESVNQADYSLKVGVEIIEYYEDYFQIKYPLPKQDMIAIPDFAFDAMENWGLIIYRETAMLYKPGVSNEANKERVALMISHELAHQWFGNLVTPSWWDDLWLNEGFAIFVDYLGIDKVHPEWRMFEKFVISDLQSSFQFDGLASSHPVYVPVEHPDEINEIFDIISYAKGATIIRMMRHFLGEETFQKGITNYLKQHSYDAAFHDDLWSALTLQAQSEGKAHIDVKAIMDTWTLQMNFPVVTVTLRYGIPDVLHVIQERYLSDPAAKDLGKYNSTFGYRWTIPLTFTSSINPKFDLNDSDVYWLYKNESSKIINISPATQLPAYNDSSSWILANIQQYGYYRVNYDASNWAALSRQLKTSHLVIPIINRAQIINDAWNLAKSGNIGLDIALATIEYLGAERDYVPWFAAVTELNFVNSMLAFNFLYGPFQRFMRDILNGSFHHFGLTNVSQDHNDVATQSLIARQSCYFGINSCLDVASEQFALWMANKSHNLIDPNLKSVVYCYAINTGGWDEWSFALERYKDADVASEKANLLSAMACTKEQWILNHFMNLILQNNSPIRKQDAMSVISNVAGNNIGRYLAWNFFRSNYATLKAEFGTSFFAWSGAIGTLTESFNTEFELNEIDALIKAESENLGSGERAFSQALEKVSSNIKWMDINLPVITKWLKDKHYLTE